MARASKNLLKAAPVKKKRIITPRGLDAKYLGEEPNWDGQEFLNEQELESRVGAAYNWYNYFTDAKFSREYLMVYMTDCGMSKAAMDMVKLTSDTKLNTTMCNTARMLSMGLEHERLRNKLNDYLVKLVEQGVAIVEAEKKAARPKLEKNPAEGIIGDIEEMLDHNPDEEWSTNFYSWLKDKRQVKPAQAKAIADYYRPALAELQETEKTKDADLKYAYRHMNKKQIQKRIALFVGIINDCESIVTNKRKSVVRKPRKAKAKTADKVVSKIQYQKEETALKIVSIDPAKLVGATELWTFNTKYNVLAHYVAGEGGLSLKGTTLQNFTETSLQKKLRKPADILPSITTSTSKSAERSFNSVTTKASAPNGRVNEFTVILRAVK
jgi:hypothetical protein